MNYEQEQLIRQAFEKGPELLAKQQIAEFFDTVYMPALWDNRLQPLMIRLTLGDAPINKLRDDQVALLLSHTQSNQQPLPQYLYAYWLYCNRERWTETPTVARMMRWAADCGIGDAAWFLRYLLRWGEAGAVDREMADKCEQEALEKGSVKAYIWQMKNRISDAEGDELGDLIDHLKERYAKSEDPIFLFLLAKAFIKSNETEKAEQCARRAIDCGLVERGYECLRTIYTLDEYGEDLEYEDWDWDRLLPILQEGADHDNPASLYLLARCADDYGCEDKSQLPQLLQRAAELGDGDSCYELAMAINNGDYGMEEDMEQAWRWFHRGAMCGNIHCFYHLYLMAAYTEDPDADQTDMEFYHTDRLKDRMPAADWMRLAKTVFEANEQEWPGDYDQPDNETVTCGNGVTHAKISYPNGDVYVGQVDDDQLPHGWGTMEYAEKECDENGVEYDNGDWLRPHCPEKYEGYWVHGKREGEGEMHYYVNGNCSRYYKGMWKNDKRHGKGTLCKIWFGGSDSHQELTGNWTDDQMPTHGELIDSICYEGELKDGKPEGHGKCEIRDGVYEGEFHNGQRHGHGVEIYDNGDRLEGEWQNGSQDGHSIYRLANGQQMEVEWEKGHFKSETLNVIGGDSAPVLVVQVSNQGFDYSHSLMCFFTAKTGKNYFKDAVILNMDKSFKDDFIEIEEVTADSVTFIVSGLYTKDSQPLRETIHTGEQRTYRDQRDCTATIYDEDHDYEMVHELKLTCVAPGKPQLTEHSVLQLIEKKDDCAAKVLDEYYLQNGHSYSLMTSLQHKLWPIMLEGDYDFLLPVYEVMARHGNPYGHLGLGMGYMEGRGGLEQDYDKAFPYIEFAYQHRGEPDIAPDCQLAQDASRAYADCLRNGWGTPADEAHARRVLNSLSNDQHDMYELLCR